MLRHLYISKASRTIGVKTIWHFLLAFYLHFKVFETEKTSLLAL